MNYQAPYFHYLKISLTDFKHLFSSSTKELKIKMPPNSIFKGQEIINLAPFLAVLNYQIDREVDFTHVHTFKLLKQSNYEIQKQ